MFLKVLFLALVVLAAAFLAAYLLSGFFRRWYRVSVACDQTHFIRTDDGARLALHRYLPWTRGEQHPRALLVHGLTGHAGNFDFTDRQSLARYLAERGIETWLLECRGAGASAAPTWLGRIRLDQDFTAHLEHDLPAAIRYLEKIPGGPLHYVGHSMGAMLGYALLSTGHQAHFRSFVSLAGPARLDFFRVPVRPWPVAVLALKVAWLLGLFAEALAPLTGRISWLARLNGLAPENLYPGDAAILGATNRDHFPARTYIQLCTFADDEASGRAVPVYRAHLERITLPVLFLVGAADEIRPEYVRPAYEGVASAEKRLVVIGKETGFSCDYRHVDLLVGKNAREDVFPLIADWILRH